MAASTRLCVGVGVCVWHWSKCVRRPVLISLGAWVCVSACRVAMCYLCPLWCYCFVLVDVLSGVAPVVL